MSQFIEMLNEPKNTLGGTEDVTELIKQNPDRIEELFQLFFQDDEWVRLRVNSVLKRLWRFDSALIQPYVGDWVDRVSKIDQPSVQWTFAQLVEECGELLTASQMNSAVKRMKSYLHDSDDWIVLNCSIAALAKTAVEDDTIKTWLLPRLTELASDSRKSVSGRASKAIKLLS